MTRLIIASFTTLLVHGSATAGVLAGNPTLDDIGLQLESIYLYSCTDGSDQTVHGNVDLSQPWSVFVPDGDWCEVELVLDPASITWDEPDTRVLLIDTQPHPQLSVFRGDEDPHTSALLLQ